MKKVLLHLVLIGFVGGCFAAPPIGYKVRKVDESVAATSEFSLRYITLNNRGNIAYQSGGAVFWSQQSGTIRVPPASVSGSRYFNEQAFNDNDMLGGMLYQGDGFTGPRGLGYTWSPTEGHKLYRYFSSPGNEDPSVVTAVAADGRPIGGYAQSTTVASQSGYWDTSTGVWSPFAIGGKARVNIHGWVGGYSNQIRNLGTGQSVMLGPPNVILAVASLSDANLVYTRTQLNDDLDMRFRVYSTGGQLLHSEDTTWDNSYMIVDSIANDQMALKRKEGYSLATTYLWNHISGGIPISTLANDSSFSQFNAFELNSINESYQIAGKARDLNGGWHVVMLEPVPEPATILALGAGLAGLLRRSKVRKNDQA